MIPCLQNFTEDKKKTIGMITMVGITVMIGMIDTTGQETQLVIEDITEVINLSFQDLKPMIVSNYCSSN